MVGWHRPFNGCEFEQTPGDGEGQGSLACCSPWVHRVRHSLGTEHHHHHHPHSACSLCGCSEEATAVSAVGM